MVAFFFTRKLFNDLTIANIGARQYCATGHHGMNFIFCFDCLSYLFGGCKSVRKVRVAMCRWWGAYTNDAEVGIVYRFFCAGGSRNSAFCIAFGNDAVNVFFLYGSLAAVDELYFKFAYINAYYFVPVLCQTAYTYTAYVAKSKN